jgi:hypothetical protein
MADLRNERRARDEAVRMSFGPSRARSHVMLAELAGDRPHIATELLRADRNDTPR